MNEIIYQKSYKEYKAELDGELQKTAEGFVRIGYLLKVARDTNILAESGYQTVTEFAEAEYNLNKTQVSRFISINDRFSEEGYSDRLKDSYKDFGYAKLTIMLQLPEAMTEELSPDYSKAEIQELKEEMDEEKKISDIELAIEKADAEEQRILPPEEGSMLGKAVWQLGKEQQEIYRKVWKAFEEGDRSRVKDILAPQGDAIYMMRIQGTGRLMLSISGEAVSITEVRSQNKERFSVEDIISEFERICPVAGMDVKEAYRSVYGDDLEPQEQKEKKEEVAPVQPIKEKRKESKVTKARTEKPKPAAVVEEEQREEEQLPGQMEVADYEGTVPEATYEEVTEDGRTGTDNIAGVSEGSGAAGDVLGHGAAETASGETEDEADIEHDESHGTAEGEGCGEDPRGIEYIWMDIYKNNAELTQYLTVWESQRSLMEKEMLKKLYDMTVNMAAGFEKLLNRGTENE